MGCGHALRKARFHPDATCASGPAAASAVFFHCAFEWNLYSRLSRSYRAHRCEWKSRPRWWCAEADYHVYENRQRAREPPKSRINHTIARIPDKETLMSRMSALTVTQQ